MADEEKKVLINIEDNLNDYISRAVEAKKAYGRNARNRQPVKRRQEDGGGGMGKKQTPNYVTRPGNTTTLKSCRFANDGKQV